MRNFMITLVLVGVLGGGLAGGWAAMNYYAPGTVGTPAHAGVVSNGRTDECTNINLSVRARSTHAHTVLLQDGDLVRGTFEVNGGFGRVDIFLRVTSPQQLDMLASPRTQQYDFTFPAQISGEYAFLFDNRFSLYTSKAVGLFYCIDRGTPQNPLLAPPPP